jgi:replication factor A1
LIEELLEEQKKNSNGSSLPSATKFFKISGYIKIIFNDDKILYLSCPDCRKKVIPEDDLWRCENCNKLHENNLPTYMLSALISDVSGNVMV